MSARGNLDAGGQSRAWAQNRRPLEVQGVDAAPGGYMGARRSATGSEADHRHEVTRREMTD